MLALLPVAVNHGDTYILAVRCICTSRSTIFELNALHPPTPRDLAGARVPAGPSPNGIRCPSAYYVSTLCRRRRWHTMRARGGGVIYIYIPTYYNIILYCNACAVYALGCFCIRRTLKPNNNNNIIIFLHLSTVSTWQARTPQKRRRSRRDDRTHNMHIHIIYYIIKVRVHCASDEFAPRPFRRSHRHPPLYCRGGRFAI